MSRKPIAIAAGAELPDYCGPYLMISLMGRNLIHLTKQYPDEHTALCGRVTRNNAFDRSDYNEFSRRLCGDCAASAKGAA